MNFVKKVCFITTVTLITIFSLNLKSFATTNGTIIESSVRLRKEASTSGDIITLLAQDAKVEVIETQGDWVKIKVGDNTGYVHKDYIKLQNESNVTKADETTNNTKSEQTNSQDNIAGSNSVTEDENSIKSENKTVNVEQSLHIVPLINSSVIYKIAPNTKLSVIKEVNGWSYIASDEFSGWIRSEKLVNIEQEKEGSTQTTEVTEKEKQEEERIPQNETTVESKTGYIKVDGANLRKNPNTTADVLTVLYKNTEIKVISTENGWSKVKTNNFEGYVSADLISDTKVSVETTSRSMQEARANNENQTSETTQATSTNENTSLGQQIVNFAMQYKGYPYVYGGAGPNSFDCSGFTQYVYKHFGYSLPHSARSQAYIGTRVSKSELRLGDLIIFTEAGSSDIGHVGIYIGNSSFIHASSPSVGVIISSLNGYYESRYITGVRVY